MKLPEWFTNSWDEDERAEVVRTVISSGNKVD